ncbi:hypothetical protein GCM10007315_13520 [Gemmobacter tilapiae]|uniref:Uncharacterized protein n=1 Tax=Neogemmobacter tilapiae TaxID=875041 RepID=A0A918TN73_9RHOB|nr:hypothetical protein GCM10007315_13520 [Gemmobacter tilapiae]
MQPGAQQPHIGKGRDDGNHTIRGQLTKAAEGGKHLAEIHRQIGWYDRQGAVKPEGGHVQILSVNGASAQQNRKDVVAMAHV